MCAVLSLSSARRCSGPRVCIPIFICGFSGRRISRVQISVFEQNAFFPCFNEHSIGNHQTTLRLRFFFNGVHYSWLWLYAECYMLIRKKQTRGSRSTMFTMSWVADIAEIQECMHFVEMFLLLDKFFVAFWRYKDQQGGNSTKKTVCHTLSNSHVSLHKHWNLQLEGCTHSSTVLHLEDSFCESKNFFSLRIKLQNFTNSKNPFVCQSQRFGRALKCAEITRS